MKITVYNDIHLGSTYELEKLLPLDKDAILNGDIVDYQNCLYKDVQSFLDLILFYKEIYGDRYILGNHELKAVPCQGYYKLEHVLFRHGDYEFWGEEKAAAWYKTSKPGAGWFKRNIIARIIDWVRRIYTARYSEEFLARAVAIAKKHDCRVIVFGHKHPLRQIDLLKDGVRILVLRRGRNIIDV